MVREFSNKVKNPAFIIQFIATLFTLGLAWKFWYEYFCERRYYVNRKLLIHVLKNDLGEFESVNQPLSIDSKISESKFTYHDKTYRIWHYTDRNAITLDGVGDTERIDHIGLFIGSVQGQNQVNQIIKLLTAKY